MPRPPLIKGLQSVWIAVTKVASVGSSRTIVDVLLKCGSAGSRPWNRETKRTWEASLIVAATVHTFVASPVSVAFYLYCVCASPCKQFPIGRRKFLKRWRIPRNFQQILRNVVEWLRVLTETGFSRIPMINSYFHWLDYFTNFLVNQEKLYNLVVIVDNSSSIA